MYQIIDAVKEAAQDNVPVLSIDEHNAVCQEIMALDDGSQETETYLALFADLNTTEAALAHQVALYEVLNSIENPTLDTMLAVNGWYQQATAPLGEHAFKLTDTESNGEELNDVTMAAKSNVDKLKAAGKKVFALIAKAAKALYQKFADVFGKLKSLLKKLIPGASKEKTKDDSFGKFNEQAKSVHDAMNVCFKIIAKMQKFEKEPDVNADELAKYRKDLHGNMAGAAARFKKRKTAKKERVRKAGLKEADFEEVVEGDVVNGEVIVVGIPKADSSASIKVKKVRTDEEPEGMAEMSTNERLQACIDMADAMIESVGRSNALNAALEEATMADPSFAARMKADMEALNNVVGINSRSTITKSKDIAKKAIKPAAKKENEK